MTLAEALNILTQTDYYATHNLFRPSFIDAGDGKVSVQFRSSPSDAESRLAFGQLRFDTSEQLAHYLAGREAVLREVAYAAQQAAQVSAQTQE